MFKGKAAGNSLPATDPFLKRERFWRLLLRHQHIDDAGNNAGLQRCDFAQVLPVHLKRELLLEPDCHISGPENLDAIRVKGRDFR